MSSVEELATEAGRLATFQAPQQLSKRRASSTKKKTPNTVSWPHETPTPNDLAHAGFYYKPTADSNDSVTCYLCGKALDGWEPEDNPIQEHLSHVPDCGWAVNVAIAQRANVEDRKEEDPMSAPLLEARLATFKNDWPHDGKRGWKCTSKKLANSGWCYAPIPEADDCVQCFYCHLSLDGWEPKDDPWEEHHRRQPECPFFELVEEAKQTKPAKAKKGAKGRTSKVSRLSTQSTMTALSEDELSGELDQTLAEEGDTVLTTASKGPGARKKAAPKKAKSTRKTTRGKSAAVTQDSEMAGAPEEEEPEAEAVPKSKSKRSTRTKKQDATIDSSVFQDDTVEEAQTVTKPARKTRGKKASAVASDVPASDLDVETVEVVDTVGAQPKRKTQRGKKRDTDTTEKPDTSIVIEVPLPPPTKTTRGKKRSSNGIEKLESSIMAAEEPARPEIPAKSPKRTAKGTRKASGQVQQRGPAAEAPQSLEAAKEVKTAPATSKRKAKASVLKVIEDTQPEPEPVQEQTPVEEEPQSVETTEGRQASVQRSPSPQSSDAENQPPSSRPSMSTPPKAMFETKRMPLAAATPKMSPSKRNIGGGLVSSQPWQAVDVEAIFARSPSLQAMGQENLKLEDVLKSLSSPEKKMTVEEWMLHNAHVSEEKLRAKCERMISMFESEGNKALRSLEGVQVV